MLVKAVVDLSHWDEVDSFEITRAVKRQRSFKDAL